MLSFIGCYIAFFYFASSSTKDHKCRVGSENDSDAAFVDYALEDLEESMGFMTHTGSPAWKGNPANVGKPEETQYSRLTKTPDEANEKHNPSNRCSAKTSHHNNDGDDRTNEETSTKLPPFRLLLQLLSQQKTPLMNASYIIAIFALYIGMSVVESLIFLYFEFLGGSNTLCGLTVAVTVLFELPLFHYAPNLLSWFGSPIGMFQLGCVAYVIRVIGYSIVPQSHPYWVLLLEPLHGITVGFVKTGSVAFVGEWFPKGYEASGQGFLALIMGLGQFVGLCLGGVLEGRTLYRVLAAIVSFGSLVLAVGSYLTIKKSYLYSPLLSFN